MKHLLKDNHDWILSGAQYANSYISEKNPLKHIPIFKDAFLNRYDFIFDVPFEQVLCTYLPTFGQKTFDPNVHDIRMIKMIPAEELKDYGFKQKRSIAVMTYELKLPFPFNTLRKVPLAFSLEFNHKEKSCLLLGKPFENLEEKFSLDYLSNKKEKRKFNIDGKTVDLYSYCCPTFCGIFYRALDDQRTIVQQVVITDTNGLVKSSFLKSKSMQKVINKRRALGLRSFIQKMYKGSENVTIEQSKHILAKDPYGNLLLEALNLK